MRTRTVSNCALLVATLVAVGNVAFPVGDASASSHREAPFITKNPKVDGTDFYMFKSFEAGRDATVTLIANYIPLQNQYGGPNFFSLDPDALYEIHIDNAVETGAAQAKEDLTFQFRFDAALAADGAGTKIPVGDKMVAIPLISSGAITGGGAVDSTNSNVLETFSITMVTGDRRTGTATDVTLASDTTVTTFRKPVDYIGQKTFGTPAEYEVYARKHIYEVTLYGCATPARVFVGQRRETFAVNLGVIFDLVNAPLAVIAQPLGTALGVDSNRAAAPNPIAAANVTSIALEVPVACIVGTAELAGNKVIGGWTTASVRQARVINPDPSFQEPSVEGGAWAQVSRLGFPLVNEAVIGLPDKNKFNSSVPENDLTNFADYVTNPTLPALVEIIFGTANYAAPAVPRQDLVDVAITGVPGVNMATNGDAGEMLRLNLGFPLKPFASQFELGAAGCFLGAGTPAAIDTTNADCDLNGFPNGRRPIDDVTDIVLSVAVGDFLRTSAAAKIVVHDAVAQAPIFRKANGTTEFVGAVAFPYLPTPNGGT